MATLEKKTLVGLLGEQAGTKLYNWLNPCCDTFQQDVRKAVGDECLVYRAVLTQSGTDAPVATVIINTLGVNVEFFYANPGQYYGVMTPELAYFNDPFHFDVSITPGNWYCDGPNAYGAIAVPVFWNVVGINSRIGDTYLDNLIGQCAPSILEVRVCPPILPIPQI